MKAIDILLIEDNDGDILLTTEALESGKIINTINILRDGKQAIDYLNKMCTEFDSAMPDLILLDINLPKKNGFEVLKHIKNKEALRHLPVIMLTTSSSEIDINMSYYNYANCFITKPVEVDDFMEAISKIKNFWISIVKLPS